MANFGQQAAQQAAQAAQQAAFQAQQAAMRAAQQHAQQAAQFQMSNSMRLAAQRGRSVPRKPRSVIGRIFTFLFSLAVLVAIVVISIEVYSRATSM